MEVLPLSALLDFTEISLLEEVSGRPPICKNLELDPKALMGLNDFRKSGCLLNDRTPLKATDEKFRWVLRKCESGGGQDGIENIA